VLPGCYEYSAVSRDCDFQANPNGTKPPKIACLTYSLGISRSKGSGVDLLAQIAGDKALEGNTFASGDVASSFAARKSRPSAKVPSLGGTASQRILFASAPFGPFFSELAAALEAQGCEVWRLCFEGGDVWETHARNRIVVPSLASDADFQALVEEELQKRCVDCVVTFNDILPRNRIVLEVAKRFSLSRFVLENGYLRPHWVTLERDGVNGFSASPRDRAFYLAQYASMRAQGAGSNPQVQAFSFRVRYHVINTIAHFAAAVVASPFLRFNPSYYGDSVWRQAWGYMREYGWRKVNNEDEQTRRIRAAKSAGQAVFTVLMQKPGDGQLVVHSKYGGNNKFLHEVVGSFASYAPKDALIVVKQHPLDYGVEKSPAFAAELFKAHRIEDRAVYLRMTSMDICMDLSDGLVTVNSTGGLAALQKGLAVKCLGAAVYDVDGLTYQGSLNSFWGKGRPAEVDVLRGYVDYLTRCSQLNGGFHSREARALLVSNVVARLRCG
jgi:capsular polysaccharide export protein